MARPAAACGATCPSDPASHSARPAIPIGGRAAVCLRGRAAESARAARSPRSAGRGSRRLRRECRRRGRRGRRSSAAWRWTSAASTPAWPASWRASCSKSLAVRVSWSLQARTALTRHSYGSRSSGSPASTRPSESYRTVWVLVCMAGLAAESIVCGWPAVTSGGPRRRQLRRPGPGRAGRGSGRSRGRRVPAGPGEGRPKAGGWRARPSGACAVGVGTLMGHRLLLLGGVGVVRRDATEAATQPILLAPALPDTVPVACRPRRSRL